MSIDDDREARRIIEEALDESVLVEAAAGTGKTTELVRRIARVIAEGRATVDRIVAVTFTRKAAGELKIRLRQELDRAREAAGDEEERRRLEVATARLEEAHIGTIHSFCAEILRERPVEARVDPLFEELSEDAAPRIYQRSFARWIQEQLAAPPAAIARAMSRKLRRDKRTPIEKLSEAGWRLVEWRDFSAPWIRKPFDREAEIDRLVLSAEQVAGERARSAEPRDPLFATTRGLSDLVLEIERREIDARRDYDLLESRLVELAGELGRAREGTGSYAPGISRADMWRSIGRLTAELTAFKRAADADLASALAAELRTLVDRYEEEKRRQGKLDFVDLLLLVRDLVRDDVAVRGFLQERFSHLFVDEFQDTDPLQMEILLLLSSADRSISDWRQVRPRPGKLFLVGDPKQSIYRFRRADIVLYQSVRRSLSAAGVRVVHLSRSFRAPREIQDAVNLGFSSEMLEDPASGQPGYVPLEGGPPAIEGQPAIIALPAPHIHGKYRVQNDAIEESLPKAVGGFIEWVLSESGYRVRDPKSGDRVPVAPRHIAILFKRYQSFGSDVTAPYVRSLEARSIPHVLVGSRSFFSREEVESIRAALSCIEWPEDELFGFATLRGSLFGFRDDHLLEWKTAGRSFAPLEVDASPGASDDLRPIREALLELASLSRERNARPIVDTVNTLLESTRAHAAFALRPAGNQVLANIQRICDLARSFEVQGGLSFRGFVELINAEAEKERSSEATIFEDGTEGVRVMTVHAAKGLEFPIVILADLTNPLSFANPDRYVDQARRLSATRLLGCAPWELSDHVEEERLRDEAEGVRVAYVASTRARDMLVIPALGQGPSSRTWVSPLDRVIYPPRDRWRGAPPAPGCPRRGPTTVLSAPEVGSDRGSIEPGLHHASEGGPAVAWWDPATLSLDPPGVYGLRQEHFLSKDDAGEALAGIARYEAWKEMRERGLEQGEVNSILPLRASEAEQPPEGYSPVVDEIALPRASERPSGPRFGTLVHAILSAVSFDATIDDVVALGLAHGRVLGATREEIEASRAPVMELLSHEIIARARGAERCLREHPVLFETDDGRIVDGTIDLCFLDGGRWTVVDFKTDRDRKARREKYLIQMKWYLFALERITGQPVRGVLLSI
jgi:ATP-dependent exoDNAse (exonuclease V) beta subunit